MPTVRVTGVDADSPYALTQEKIVLPHLVARAFGGTVQGEAQITNWNLSSLGKKGPLQRGATRLHLSGVQISKVAGRHLHGQNALGQN